jgi:uncharacterized protein
MKEHDAIIWHLDREYTEPVRDPIWNHIYLSKSMLKLVNTRPFQKLSRIKQLGPAFMVYPGATHTRLSHSLGVFFLARRIIRAILSRGEPFPVTIDGVKAFLVASLLHDLGHFPYAHSLKELPLIAHEKLTAEIILTSELKTIIEKDVGIDPEMAAAIVDESIPIGDSKEIVIFRNILSGVLDPDKLDYLCRDAFFCGVPYGFQDIDYIINRIHPHSIHGFAIDESGIPLVENLLFSKYLMYRAVYWHKTVRIATAMIKKAVLMGILSGDITGSELYGRDDEEFFTYFNKKSFPPYKLMNLVEDRNFFKTAAEIPFDGTNPFQLKLTDLIQRSEIENHISVDLKKQTGLEVKPEQVIIDIPEPISFEVNFPIVSGSTVLNYPDTSTVFSKPVISRFSRVLRSIRLILPEHLALKAKNPEDYLYGKNL